MSNKIIIHKRCAICDSPLCEKEVEDNQCYTCQGEVEKYTPANPINLIAYFIVILLLLMTLFAKAQCEPDTRFAPSYTIELVSDWGFIMQGGITGQLSRISLHLGLRVRTMIDSTTGKASADQPTTFPRLELGYRIIDGLHLNAGIAKVPDVSVTWYKRVGGKAAIYVRGMYDQSFNMALGLKVLFIKY